MLLIAPKGLDSFLVTYVYRGSIRVDSVEDAYKEIYHHIDTLVINIIVTYEDLVALKKIYKTVVIAVGKEYYYYTKLPICISDFSIISLGNSYMVEGLLKYVLNKTVDGTVDLIIRAKNYRCTFNEYLTYLVLKYVYNKIGELTVDKIRSEWASYMRLLVLMFRTRKTLRGDNGHIIILGVSIATEDLIGMCFTQDPLCDYIVVDSCDPHIYGRSKQEKTYLHNHITIDKKHVLDIV